MHEPADPLPVAALASLREGAAFVFRGRVIELDRGEARVVDASGSAWVGGFSSEHEGALVEARGARQRDRLVATAIDVLAAPRGGKLRLDGDVHRLLARPRGLEPIVGRARALAALRAFFASRGYLEVETPTLVTNPGMDVHLDAFRVEGTGRYLSTSPEYAMKRLVACGLERIVQVTRSYRRDESGSLHEPEFTICEWYRAHADADFLMHETEALVAAVVAACNDGSTVVRRGGAPIDLAPPWPRITLRDALRVHAGLDLEALLRDEEALFRALAFEVEPKLGIGRPTWVVDWPLELASLARPKPGDPRVVERFEAYVAGIELCNGFGELTDPIEQRRRFEAALEERGKRGKTLLPMDEHFLAALEDGMPDCAGNALGFDRLAMIATSSETIDDVLSIGFERA